MNTHWGGVDEEPNSFGTHEFLELRRADRRGRLHLWQRRRRARPRRWRSGWNTSRSDTTSTLANERRKNGRDKPWKLDVLRRRQREVGLRRQHARQYAADLVRRYQTFVKVPQGQPLKKIAAGANVDDYHWTEVFMREMAKLVNGLSIHYYTSPGLNWNTKRSSTDFGEDQWIETLSKALLHGRARHEAQRDHGPLRSRQESRVDG